jgi:hypothetical protein
MFHFLLVLYVSTINKNKISPVANISFVFWIFLKWPFLAYWQILPNFPDSYLMNKYS